jgi:fimbrial chaperone protein
VFASFVVAAPAFGSVVMTGTRVIYPANARERGIQLTNEDETPNLVQIWVDDNDPDSTPDNASAPFVATPPVFRMEPKAGQAVRLMFTGQDLPQDRESVFYLNVLQIPSTDARLAEQSQFVVMLRNRLKLFYRPEGIDGGAEGAPKQLRFRVEQDGQYWRVTANNPSGYYVSLTSASIVGAGAEAPFKPSMVPPRSEAVWSVEHAGKPAGASLRVKFRFVNDYGSETDGEYVIPP